MSVEPCYSPICCPTDFGAATPNTDSKYTASTHRTLSVRSPAPDRSGIPKPRKGAHKPPTVIERVVVEFSA